MPKKHSKKLKWIETNKNEKKIIKKNQNLLEMLSSNSSHSHFSSLIDESELKNNKKLSIINETKEEDKKSENNKKNISKKNSPSSSFSSLEFNSRIESKNKSYNFDNGLNNNNNNEIPLTKYEEFLKFKKNLNNINKNYNNNNNNLNVNSRIHQRNNLYENINSKIKNIENNQIINDYSLEIKTLEEPTYDDFFKLKHKNIAPKKNLFPSKNNNNNIIIENPKKKKEREKMKGYTCELCNKFYDAIGESNNQNICNECSRHKSLYNIVKTPESFYDLNL